MNAEGVQHTRQTALDLANNHISRNDDVDNDGCVSMDELRDDTYKTLWESINHHTNAKGEVCADHLAKAYHYANIQEVGSDAQGNI